MHRFWQNCHDVRRARSFKPFSMALDGVCRFICLDGLLLVLYSDGFSPKRKCPKVKGFPVLPLKT